MRNISTQIGRVLFLLCTGAVIFSFLAFQQGTNKDWLPWKSPDQLGVSDFRKKHPGRPVKFKTGKRSYRLLEGFIQTGISFSYSGVNGRLSDAEVFAYMVPSDSWLADKTNLETLEHEQAHFNITEIYARRLRRKLQANVKIEQARRFYQQTMNDLKSRQQLFDREHKSESGVNDEWKRIIREELQALEEWSYSRR